MTETEALLAKEPTVEIAGRTCTLHPLGLEAMAPLARMLEVAQARTGVDISDIVSLSQDMGKVAKLLLAAMGWAQDEVLLLLGASLGVTQEELRDPKRFPLTCFGALIVALSQQVDLAGFLSGHIVGTSSAMTPIPPSPEPSDESAGKSNAEPDGPTSSSVDSASLAG